MSHLFRADHVGSFLRPPELLEARREQVSLEELETLEDRHISRVLQKAAGTRSRCVHRWRTASK